MPGRKRNQPVPRPVVRSPRINAWINRIYGVAAISLLGLALMVILGVDVPALRWTFVGVIALAGTGAIILQSRRICPACGAAYGYHLRFVNANKCRQCGADLPEWRPGRESPD